MKGSHGWLVVAGVVVIIDLLARPQETLSDSAHRALRKNPVVVSSLVGLTAAHLTLGAHKYWQKIDPFVFVGQIRRWTALGRA